MSVIGGFGNTLERYRWLTSRTKGCIRLSAGSKRAHGGKYGGDGGLTIHPAKAAEETAPSSQHDCPGAGSTIDQLIWIRCLGSGDRDRAFRLNRLNGRHGRNLQFRFAKRMSQVGKKILKKEISRHEKAKQFGISRGLGSQAKLSKLS